MLRNRLPGSAPGAMPVLPEHSESLLSLSGGVDLDGGAATFDVLLTNQPAFRAVIPFGMMPQVMTEIRRASAVMLHRQHLRLDKGAEALLELCETALRPARVEVIVDPRNQDRLIVHQFGDHPPLVFRFDPLQAVTIATSVATKLAAMNH